MKTKRLLLRSLMAFAFLSSQAVLANGEPRIHLREIIHAGSGCLSGGETAMARDDGNAMVLWFSEFMTEVGSMAPSMSAQKNCRMYLDIEVPQGYSYAIKSIEYVGFSSLEKGVQAQLNTSIYFTGSDLPSRYTHAAFGPLDQDLLITNEIPEDSMLWSPCGDQEAMNINMQSSLDNTSNPKVSGIFTIDSIKFTLQWKRCSAR